MYQIKKEFLLPEAPAKKKAKPRDEFCERLANAMREGWKLVGKRCVGDLPVVVTPKYKYIADAIRKGAKKVPEQTIGAMYRDKHGLEVFKSSNHWVGTLQSLTQIRSTCALGAALLYLNRNDIPEPIAHDIMHLNDFNLWSREAIADWLETL